MSYANTTMFMSAPTDAVDCEDILEVWEWCHDENMYMPDYRCHAIDRAAEAIRLGLHKNPMSRKLGYRDLDFCEPCPEYYVNVNERSYYPADWDDELPF